MCMEKIMQLINLSHRIPKILTLILPICTPEYKLSPGSLEYNPAVKNSKIVFLKLINLNKLK